jgi:signal transduction histidine kinase
MPAERRERSPAKTLTEEMEVTPADVEVRKAFLELGPEDQRRLEKLRPFAERYAQPVIDDLYKLFLSHEPTRAFFEDEAVLERVKELQKTYFLRLTEGKYDAAYIENRLNVGAVHERIGLVTPWYLGAYAFYIRAIAPRLFDEYEDRNDALATLGSLLKVIFLDMGLAIDTYIDQRERIIRGQQDEIRRQLEELTQLQSLKDDLISLIVHDLRNPLAGVSSCLKLIEPKPSAPDPGGLREMVALAREGLRKLSELVTDLLEVHQLEEKKLELRRERCAVGELLRQAAATLEATARLSGVKLELAQVADVSPAVDIRLVRRSIENLISNALKFSVEGSAVTLGAERAGEAIAIEVADRGPGLPDELKDRLFTKFASVEKTPSQVRRGYGLGLYVVKLVATAHGGSVEARPREGGGTVFRITLPFTA